jgi:hypothetical protein
LNLVHGKKQERVRQAVNGEFTGPADLADEKVVSVPDPVVEDIEAEKPGTEDDQFLRPGDSKSESWPPWNRQPEEPRLKNLPSERHEDQAVDASPTDRQANAQYAGTGRRRYFDEGQATECHVSL